MIRSLTSSLRRAARARSGRFAAVSLSSRGGDPRVDNVALGRHLFDLFSRRQNRFEANNFLSDNILHMNLHNVSVLLRCGGKSDIKVHSKHLRELSAVIDQDSVSPADESKLLSSLLYGMKVYSSRHDGIPELLASIRRKLEGGVTALDGQFFGNSLYGMQHMSSEEPEVLALVDVLARKLTVSGDDLDAQALGNALYGLQNMDNDASEVNRLLAALSVKLQETPDTLQPRHIANALYGLQRMSVVSPELEEIWRQLTPHVRRCEGEFTAQNIGNAFYGFSRLQSFRSSALSDLLAPLNDIVLNFSAGELDDRAITNIFQGLSGADGESAEALFTLDCMGKHVRKCKNDLSAQQTARALQALAGFSSEHREVRSVVKALAWRLVRVQQLKLRYNDVPGVVAALGGLSTDSKEVEALLSALIQILPVAGKQESATATNYVYTASDISRILGGIRLISTQNDVGSRLIAYVLDLIGPALVPTAMNVSSNTTGGDILGALEALAGKRLGDNKVPELTALVAQLVRRSTVPGSDFSADELMRSMRCLKSLLSTSGTVECTGGVEQLLRAVCPVLLGALKAPNTGDSRGTPLTHSELGEIFSGLKNLGSHSSHTQAFIRVIKTYHRKIGGTTDITSLCHYLSGMAYMDGGAPVISGILGEIAKQHEGDAIAVLDNDLCGEAVDGSLFLQALQGCRRLSAGTPAGAVILERLSNASTKVILSEEGDADIAAKCFALAGLRGFCDSHLNGTCNDEQRNQISRLVSAILESLQSVCTPETLLTPLQYGSILMTTYDFLPLFLSQHCTGPLSDEYLSILCNLKNIASTGNSALCEWERVLRDAGAVGPISSGKAEVSKKRPVVTSSDVILLRQALHMTLAVLDEIVGEGTALGAEVDDLLGHITESCIESLSRVDAKHTTPVFEPYLGHNEDSSGGSDSIEQDDSPDDFRPYPLRINGLTYAEKKHSKLRRRYRNLLAAECLERSRELVVPKVNPSLLNIFNTDVILSYDLNGADLSKSIDLRSHMPYSHLLNPVLFPLYTSENGSNIHNIVLDVEKKDNVFSSACGVDSHLLSSLKLRFLRKALGADNVSAIGSLAHQNRSDGPASSYPLDLRSKKLLLLKVSLEEFENLSVTETLNTVLETLNFVEVPK